MQALREIGGFAWSFVRIWRPSVGFGGGVLESGHVLFLMGLRSVRVY